MAQEAKDTIYDLMQRAVDIVHDSPHPDNKIAATLAGVDQSGNPFSVSYTNYWPPAIHETIGMGTRIGNSSGTVHAETACIIHAPATKDAALFVTDPPCPNCVKNMAEAGIKALYIDHKGFNKDFARRRGHHFTAMSMRICEKAGISVYEIRRKEEKRVPIFETPESFTPQLEKPPQIEAIEKKDIDHLSFLDCVKSKKRKYKKEPFAVAVARDPKSKTAYLIAAERHPVIGYISETMEEKEEKYSLLLEPVNRLIMTAALRGLKIDPDYLFSSRTPTARELVNMVGAGLEKITISDIHESRDKYGLKALEQLRAASILSTQPFS